MSDLSAPTQLLATLGGLWLLATLLASHLQGLVLLVTRRPGIASMTYDLLVFPGVVVHELAHLVVAVLLRVRVLRAELFRFRGINDLRQGEVIVERADPLRMSLIGAAPLLVGVPLVLLLLRGLDLPPIDLSLAALVPLRTVLHEPFRLLGLYVLWAIANAMFPSAADRAAWWIVGLGLAVLVGIVVLTGAWSALPLDMHAALFSSAARLNEGLFPILLLDLGLLCVVVGLEWAAGRLRGRRVVRRR
jgi:hypothetical protein